MEWWACLAWLIIGFVFGCIATQIIFRAQSSYGTFRIDRTGPDRDVFRLDARDLDLDEAAKKRYLVFKIDLKDDYSPE